MTRPGLRIAGVLALFAGVTGNVPPSAAALKCSGEEVTISYQDPGVGTTILGTSQRDVIMGGPQDEQIRAGRGDDVVCGGDGDDFIEGGPGSDGLLGGEGNDTFNGRAANSMLAVDTLVGGIGLKDRATYATSPVGVRVNLSSRSVTATGVSDRGAITGIEVIIGSEHDDALIGDATANILVGLGGNDFIEGRGRGGDRLDGRRGRDVLSYAAAPERVRLRLTADAVEIDGGNNEPDEVTDFEIVVGSKFDDRLFGDRRDQQLSGGPGNDVIDGNEGDDILRGDEGDDTIHPGPGNDFVDGGPNDPVTNSNHPGDLVSYVHETLPKPAPDQGEAEFHIDLGPRFGPGASGLGDDSFVGIESARGLKNHSSFLDGDAGPNVLIGGAKEDYIHGGGGDDHLFGLGFPDNLWGDDGDDFLDPGANGEMLDGGEGTDTCAHRDDELSLSCEAGG